MATSQTKFLDVADDCRIRRWGGSNSFYVISTSGIMVGEFHKDMETHEWFFVSASIVGMTHCYMQQMWKQFFDIVD